MPERTSQRQPSADAEAEADAPQLYLLGGTDELYLEEEGRVFHPGDAMPRTLTNAKRMSLQTAGIQFGTQHPEMAAASQDAGRASGDAEPAAGAPGAANTAANPEDRPRRAAKE